MSTSLIHLYRLAFDWMVVGEECWLRRCGPSYLRVRCTRRCECRGFLLEIGRSKATNQEDDREEDSTEKYSTDPHAGGSSRSRTVVGIQKFVYLKYDG